ncbi:cubilin-like [Cydia pomonella]|uniref:cubilin-like n=1 Tax=Cydia pomonella TaxID=82600 RepID=UPI002ADDD8E2|nr:cubilin-like [Cydia pomonella]
MSALLIKYLFLTVWFMLLDCEVYQDRPKIKTSDGDLILQPALDKNIYLLPNGPRSKVFVGDTDLLAFNRSSSPSIVPSGPASNYDAGNYRSDIMDILRRLDNLENRDSISANNARTNMSMIWRRTNRMITRITHLETQISSLTRDACQSNPCAHGGTCLTLVGGYHCLCPSNWEGTDCDVDVNECRNFAGTDLGCQNGASCINKPGSYECQCKFGWFGVHCTRKQKDCSGGNYEICGHGTCVEAKTGTGITCFCNQGWTQNDTGSACLIDVNECDPSQGLHCSVNPRVECINTPGSFRCGTCPPGYEGDGYICSDIDECMTIPNGGCSPLVTCHNTIGSRICGNCPPGYIGDGITCSWRGTCSVNRGGCHPSAQCIDNPGFLGQTSPCVCPAGMAGDGVGPHGCYVSTGGNSTQGCESNPCVHGRCHVLRQGYTCICYNGYGGAHCDAPTDHCASNPCYNGGVCRQDSSMSKGFRCECLAQYTGDLCDTQVRTCGGILDNEEGSLYYPLHNSSYTHDSKCAWVIRTVPDKVINVTFSKFNLEDNPDCNYDFLQIHDGRTSASQLIGRFCGSSFPKGGNIVSNQNYLYFWFISDSSINKDGFALHWTSIPPVCGGEIDATKHGRISSPGSPGKYPPNRDCYWHLQTNLNKRIQLHFYELDIEKHSNCSFDYIAIYDGEQSTDPLLAKYCNSTLPAPIHSVGSDILIHFHSDAYGSGNGFQISYAPTDGHPGCGGLYTMDRGEIVSPSFNGTYLHNLICDYKIQTGPETKIRITFLSFALERSIHCRYDYLKIYDGPSPDSRLYGKFCGNTYPKTPFISSSNSIFIKFHTDYNVASEGFKIIYESVCQHTIFGDSGVIKSPSYPNNYPANRVCEYVIHTIPGKAIILTFQDFNLEEIGDNCRYDNVEIRDGPDVNATSMGRYCGGSEHMPPTLISTHNFMYIRFSSDMSLSGTGFYANYSTIDTKCGGIYRDNTGLINHPKSIHENYENHQTCTWILSAPEGFLVKLTWNRFDLEDMDDCESDYLEIIEFDDTNQNDDPQKYCGTTLPPALTSTTNRLMLRFHSDSSIRKTGFSVLYSFLDAKLHCGGNYIKTHGYIYSPGWPNPYERNRDCTWTITVPVGQQIILNISQFDLELPSRGSCDSGDFLEIKNGASANSPPAGKFCGSFQSKTFKSLGNTISVHFHSDAYLQGRGFKIEWDGTITGCGGTLTSASGSISSPNYPQTYNDNAECFYKVVTNPGSRIKISFIDLDLERTPDCRDDYVEIFDGLTVNDPTLGRYCEMSPAVNRIVTSSNYAYIKFRSDIYIGSKGFYLNYNTVCNNNITGSYGVLESPDFPGKYQGNLNCLWTITVPKGHKINVTYTHFDIYKSLFIRRYPVYRSVIATSGYRPWSSPQHGIMRVSDDCGQDYLQIRQLPDSDFSQKLCGFTIPAAFTTKSNVLQIKLVTSGFMAATGFRLEWVRHGCGGILQKSYGTFSSDINEMSDEEMECEWLLQAPLGRTISITFTDIYLTETNNCTTDAIEIYSGPTLSSPLITKLCRRQSSSVQSNSNILLVRYVKKSNLRGAYFKSQYSSYQTGCGGRLISPTGMFMSKNYPQNYDTDTDCIWHISVPKYHRIEINFLDIDLYSSFVNDDDCHDFIKIYEGYNIYSSNNYSKLICPRSGVTKYISNSNRVAVQFMSNSYGTSKGFKANFSMTCGAFITVQSDGIITSDKYLNHSNRSCTWTLVAPRPDQKITLTITHISIPKNYDIVSNRNCPSSYLRILEGNDEYGPVIGEYCGNKVPQTIVSQGSALTIELGTYGNNITGQFSAHYTSLSNACGGSYTSEQGTIASPNYPLAYPGSADCEWILSTSPGNRVYVIFEKFDLAFSEGCNEDYLELRENNGAGRLIGVYCGNLIPTNTTSATKIYMKFHSDSKNAGTGFLAHYGFLHGNEITGLENGEISSPLYPASYEGTGEYTWRIMSTGESLSLIVDRLEIHTYGTRCSNHLAIYDGFDDSAPVLQELCGIQIGTKEVRTSRSVVFIKLKLDNSNTGSIFHIRWAESSTEIESPEPINCGSNITELIRPGKTVTVKSPGYPESYADELMCEWLYKSLPGQHISLEFLDFQLEERPNCFADYVSVMGSDTGMEWKPIKEFVCTNEGTQNIKIETSFMKLIFKSDYSMTEKGFRALVSSKCGGHISESSGEIGVTWQELSQGYLPNIKCQWRIKVRPGRVIKFKFEQFNITNRDNDCYKYVTVRNGDSEEAPLLGSGKYCGYSHEKRGELETSSNALFVTFNSIRNQAQVQTFRLHYEEKNIECGVTSTLDTDHSWEVFSTPNYPSIPLPYSECIWVFSGPVGEILRIDFSDFDLKYDTDCKKEALEVRNGVSSVAPLIGRYCNDKPGSIKSISNSLYIRYVTQSDIPNRGLKANVSIDVCGGTIVANSGEVSSPGFPHLTPLSEGTICEWRITGYPGYVFHLKPQTMDLPESVVLCATKVTIADGIENQYNANIRILDNTTLKTFCNEDTEDLYAPIETSSNEVIIKYYVGKRSYYHNPDSKGFRFTFNSSRPMCGGPITTPEGYIMTPGYPRKTTMHYCYWIITVPDTSRRVRLEIEDYNLGTDTYRIAIYNDNRFQTLVQSITNKDLNPGKIFESSGNKLAVYILMSPLSSEHNRFKAKFSSNELALCGGTLKGDSGELASPVLNRSYSCDWSYRRYSIENQDDDNENVNNVKFSTILINAKVNSSLARTRCLYSDPKLSINAVMTDKNVIFKRELCGNNELQFRIPSDGIDLKATQNKGTFLNFHLDWKLQPCGGVVTVGEESVNVLNVPNNYNDSLDCAWILRGSSGNRIKIKIEGSFQLSCSDEFIQISQGLEAYQPIIGDYCRDKIQTTDLVMSFSEIYIQYHSNIQNKTSIKVMAEIVNHQCGGYLNRFYRMFTSPNYPKNYIENQECAWEIEANVGNRVSLNFIDRFVIEDTPNCTKDMVIIYDWDDNSYTEIARVCGRNLPPVYNSTNNRMKVVLRTDSDTNLDGFKAIWTPICGGKYKAKEKEQILYSPGFPDNYMPSLDCSYEISAPGQKIALKFLEFELEGTYPECSYDNVSISADNMYYYSDNTYCGTETPTSNRYGDKITIRFRTDRFIQRKGFKLSYSLFSCGGNVTKPTVISSGEGENYDRNLNCTWFIEAPANKIVIVKFTTIKIEGRSCSYDYIELYNGHLLDYNNRIIKTCGFLQNEITVFRGTGNKMLLHFVTDGSVNYEGFKAGIFFSYGESVGCGGYISLTEKILSETLSSPLINSSSVYENFLDCHWSVTAPDDRVIKLEFISFHVAPCQNVNQTALGYSKCDCDFVEIRDGLNPDSTQIGVYCGHTTPTQVISSGNQMSIRLSTDGEINSSGFRIRLTAIPNVCGQSTFSVSTQKLVIRSPGYHTGSIPRGLNCVYEFIPSSEYSYRAIHVRINQLDLRPGDLDRNQCTADKLTISGQNSPRNLSLGSDYIHEHGNKDVFDTPYYFEETLTLPKELQLCGTQNSGDYYLYGTTVVNVHTSPDFDSKQHRGFEIEVSQVEFCGRNYTESQGRIRAPRRDIDETEKDCYTLITAPENYTISAYFIHVNPDYWNENVYLEVFDGDKTSSRSLVKVSGEYDSELAVFSTGRYLLFHNHQVDGDRVGYDLNYIITNKGQGCGGKMQNEFGLVSSPLYPNVYRQKNNCEWELETLIGTKLRLHFSIFDLGAVCNENYVKLVKRNGDIISTYCDETPADYTSDDNYVKIVFVTNMNNGGTGWLAHFIGIV